MGIPFALTVGVLFVALLLAVIGFTWPWVGVGMLVLLVIVTAFVLSLKAKDFR
jgi:hypothetical protein